MEAFTHHFNFWIYIILLMIGMYAMIAKNNLIKKLIGMSIFQTAIILFFISLGSKTGANIPIIIHGKHHESEAHAPAVAHPEPAEGEKPLVLGPPPLEKETHGGLDPDNYVNPLPHVLMLTAIVVGVSTLGVALAITQRIFKDYGSLEENEILERSVKPSNHA